MHVCSICDRKLDRGMLFCDHSTTIEAISVVKHNKNNNLYVKLLAKTKLELF